MIKLKFQILDEVSIIPLKYVRGTIINVWIDTNTIQYKVRYFVENEIKEIYFYEKELSIETKEQQKTIGFNQ